MGVVVRSSIRLGLVKRSATLISGMRPRNIKMRDGREEGCI